MDLKKHWESLSANIKKDLLQYYQHQAKSYPYQDTAKFKNAYEYIAHLRHKILEAVTTNSEETYWYYVEIYQKAMIKLMQKMVDELTWGEQHNFTEEEFDEFARPFTGSWKKFSRFHKTDTVELANTEQEVYDWTLPLHPK